MVWNHEADDEMWVMMNDVTQVACGNNVASSWPQCHQSAKHSEGRNSQTGLVDEHNIYVKVWDDSPKKVKQNL